jgi:hypothetical protein
VTQKCRAINGWCINRKIYNGNLFRLFRQCAKGLYAAMRSLHSLGIAAKMHFSENN